MIEVILIPIEEAVGTCLLTEEAMTVGDPQARIAGRGVVQTTDIVETEAALTMVLGQTQALNLKLGAARVMAEMKALLTEDTAVAGLSLSLPPSLPTSPKKLHLLPTTILF